MPLGPARTRRNSGLLNVPSVAFYPPDITPGVKRLKKPNVGRRCQTRYRGARGMATNFLFTLDPDSWETRPARQKRVQNQRQVSRVCLPHPAKQESAMIEDAVLKYAIGGYGQPDAVTIDPLN